MLLGLAIAMLPDRAPVVTGAKAAGLPAKPNILFIAVDDLRPELGCYDNPIIHSPNIDRLAQTGLLFDHAYCQEALCSPSRSSLLTGTRPDTTQVWDLKTHFRRALPDIVTLPQYFKNSGYFAQGMGKIFHLGLDDPASWSIPTTFPRAHAGQRGPVDPDARPVSAKRGPPFQAVDVPDNALHDGELADMAVAALRGLEVKSQPFFLAVGFIRPHLPFVAPKKYWDLYESASIPLAPNPFPPRGAPDYAIVPLGEVHSYAGVPKDRHLPDDYARKLKHGYYAAVSYVDAQVGRVLDGLDKLGLRDSTIVVLWGDHGWKLGEHDAWAKHSDVENDTRAPLLVSVPGMSNAGKHSEALVEFVDVYPTLAELAGLPLPKHLEGLSFGPLLRDPQKPWKTAAFSQYPRQVAKQKLMGYTMRTHRYRLTRWGSQADPTKVDAVELYDHQADPQENTNIANDAANKELVQELTAQLLAGWKKAIPSSPDHLIEGR
jgi:iduronate 2-sulfatase